MVINISLHLVPKKCSNHNIELAKEAAREGIVLLKNDQETLPLDNKKIKSLALIGPRANATYAMIGNYAGFFCFSFFNTFGN